MALQNQDSQQELRHIDRRKLPVIDVSSFLHGVEGAKEVAAQELRILSEDIGFASVVGHGVSQQLIDDVEGETKRFHDLSADEKLRIEIVQHQRGYVRPKATLIKHSTYAENKKFDLNATLVMASEYEDDDPGVVAGKQFYAKNQWPEGLPGFKETVLDYMFTMTALGKSMLPLFAAALELEDGFFDPYFENNYTYLRMSHYPPKPVLEEDEYGLGAHADTGFMTFFPQQKKKGSNYSTKTTTGSFQSWKTARSSSISASFSNDGPTAGSGRRRIESSRRVRTIVIQWPALSTPTSSWSPNVCPPATTQTTRRNIPPRRITSSTAGTCTRHIRTTRSSRTTTTRET